MLQRFYSIYLICLTAITAPFFFLVSCLIWLLTVSWDKQLKYVHYLTSFWAKLIMTLSPCWHYKVFHRERFKTDQPYIIVSNHQSGIDILLAYALNAPFKWLSKIEVFKIPFIGWNMYLNRYIGLKRGDRRSVAEMSAAVSWHLKNGSSVYMFPEGSRSQTGELHAFKNGAFAMAKHNHVGIIPVVIRGTSQALPKNSLKLGRADMSLEVLPVIDAQTVDEQTTTELCKYVEQLFKEALNN
ncbi:lysophospholipid acyltransferase family protein [Celerinatantimonas sp. YJH-8]|uniref:lysophospholipid acyltransferase family protein n=1 Tax=Celerinatantimonas sp. YJH-8 TaxID=3228714 RepID=UPI0038CBFF12